MDLLDDLTLPLASGGGWWYWLGGRPAFDFVNTLRERWWRNVETLVTPADLCAWLDQAGLLHGPAKPDDRQLHAARRLRDAIDAGILSAIDSRPAPPFAVAESMAGSPGRWRLTNSPTTAERRRSVRDLPRTRSATPCTSSRRTQRQCSAARNGRERASARQRPAARGSSTHHTRAPVAGAR